MKTWRELIAQFEADPSPRLRHCDPEEVGRALGIQNTWGINHDAFDDRFQSSAMVSWQCTDTVVGLDVILLDGVVVGVGSQPYRKSDYEISWLSAAQAAQARDVMLSLFVNNPVDVLDLDEVIDDWWFEQESS